MRYVGRWTGAEQESAGQHRTALVEGDVRLVRSLRDLRIKAEGLQQCSQVLEYGCGTAQQPASWRSGGTVHGIALVPDAIKIAQQHASERELHIRFKVADICRWEEGSELYNVVLDSFCLQSIVLDADREAVLNGVRGGSGLTGSTCSPLPSTSLPDTRTTSTTRQRASCGCPRRGERCQTDRRLLVPAASPALTASTCVRSWNATATASSNNDHLKETSRLCAVKGR